MELKDIYLFLIEVVIISVIAYILVRWILKKQKSWKIKIIDDSDLEHRLFLEDYLRYRYMRWKKKRSPEIQKKENNNEKK